MNKLNLCTQNKETIQIQINTDFSFIIESLLTQINSQRIFIISQATIYDSYVKLLEQALQQRCDCRVILVSDGEEAKSLSEVERVLDIILNHGVERSDTIIGIGGGVVGDLSGFIASICLRGLKFIQIPTTLLAQVDASIGGKTGVNHSSGKNLIGSFYQPNHICISISVLSTLSKRECLSGFAEIIKYGIISDPDLFDTLDKNSNILKEFNFIKHSDLWKNIITKSAEIKVTVVQQDEKESGLRAILNFGHTIGHAIEAYYGYGGYKHGECVAIGMVAATFIAVNKGLLSQDDATKIYTLIQAYDYHLMGLKPVTIEMLLCYLKRDKKVKQGLMHFILPESIGKVRSVSTISEDDIKLSLDFINEFFKEQTHV